jgi:hypothetical protein
MTTLPDEEIRTIAKDVATANAIPVQDVSTAPIFDSDGKLAVEVTITIPPEQVSSILGEPYYRTITGIIREVADKGEERFPLVRIREKKSAS